MAGPLLAGLARGLSTGSSVAGQAGGMISTYPPLGEYLKQKAFSTWPNVLPSVPDLILLLRWGLITEQFFWEASEKQGLAREHADHLFKASTQLLSPLDYVTLSRRGEFADLPGVLKKMGFSEDHERLLLKLGEVFPGPDDLIRFAVRDVFSAKAGELGLFEAFNDSWSKMKPLADKTGLTEDVAKLFWGAHWNLPPLTQLYEWFHRDFITEEQLRAFISAHDFSPKYHDQFIKNSYAVLTRVDVRRMFRVGVLDKAGVNRAYLDLGYNDRDAQALADFTERYEQDPNKGLTKDAIVRGYKMSVIDHAGAEFMLKQLEFGDDVIAYILALADAENELDSLEETERTLRALWVSGKIDEAGLRDAFGKQNASAKYTEAAIGRIMRGSADKEKLPSRSEFENWFKLRIIGEDEYMQGLLQLGYSRPHALNYLSEASIELSSDELKPLSYSVYAKWVSTDVISEQDFRGLAARLKLSPEDIERTLIEARNKRAKSKQGA